MPNGLDQDQGRRYVGSDLDSNCMQRLSADDKSRPTVANTSKSVNI